MWGSGVSPKQYAGITCLHAELGAAQIQRKCWPSQKQLGILLAVWRQCFTQRTPKWRAAQSSGSQKIRFSTWTETQALLSHSFLAAAQCVSNCSSSHHLISSFPQKFRSASRYIKLLPLQWRTEEMLRHYFCSIKFLITLGLIFRSTNWCF